MNGWKGASPSILTQEAACQIWADPFVYPFLFADGAISQKRKVQRYPQSHYSPLRNQVAQGTVYRAHLYGQTYGLSETVGRLNKSKDHPSKS